MSRPLSRKEESWFPVRMRGHYKIPTEIPELGDKKAIVELDLTLSRDYGKITFIRPLRHIDGEAPKEGLSWRHKSRYKRRTGVLPKEALLTLRDILNLAFPPEKDDD